MAHLTPNNPTRRRMLCALLVCASACAAQQPTLNSRNPTAAAAPAPAKTTPAPGDSIPPPPVCDLKTSTPRKCAIDLYKYVSIRFVIDQSSKEAADGFQQVAQLDPTFGAPWFNLGVLAEARKDWPDAQHSFEKYIEIAPKGADVPRATQELETLKPYLAGKVTDADRQRIDYDNSIDRARILLDKKFYKEAMSEAGHAQSVDATRWEAYAVISLIMRREKRADDSVHYAYMALQRAPADKQDDLKKTLLDAPPAASH